MVSYKRLLVVLSSLFILGGCQTKLPTERAASLEKKICACQAPSCLELILSEFEAFQSDYNGFEDPKAAKAHLNAAFACAKKIDPAITEKVVARLQKAR